MLSCLKSESVVGGRIMMLTSQVVFSFAVLFLKLSKSDGMTLMFIRAVSGIFLTALHARLQGEQLFREWRTVEMAVNRGMIVAVSLTAFSIAIKLISLSLWAILSRLQLVVLMVASVMVQGNPFNLKVVLSGLLSLIGVVLVISPGLLGLDDLGNSGKLALSGSKEEIIGLAAFAVWLFWDSGSVLYLSKIASQISLIEAQFFFHVCLSIFSTLWIIQSSGSPILYWNDSLYYIGMSLCYYLALLLMTQSFRVEKNVATQSIMMSVFSLCTFIIDYFVLDTRFSLVN